MAGKKRSKSKKRSSPAKRVPAGTPSRGTGTAASSRTAEAPAAAAPSAKPAAAPPPKRTRAERLEEARRARQRKARLTRLGVGAVLVVLVGIVAVLVTSGRREEQAARRQLTAGSCRFDTRSDPLRAPPNNHVPPARYEVDPPAGGSHAPAPAPAGVYGGERPPPPDGQLVHSLEHGFVILWHRPGLPEEDMSRVLDVHDRFSDDVLVVPRPSLDVEVAATAWGRRLLCAEVEPARLGQFVERYRNQAPERRP